MTVTTGLHKDATDADLHLAYRRAYADATARLAGTYTADDEGHLFRQSDDNSLWMLTDYTGPTFQPLGSSTALHTDVAGEINGLTEKTTPVAGDMFIIEDSADSYNKKKVDFSNLPSGGGGVTMNQADPYGIHHRISGSNADDDEFATDSSAGYTIVTPSASAGSITWVNGTNHVLSAKYSGQGSARLQGYMKPMTLADGDSMESIMRILSPSGINYAAGGLVLSDGVLSTSNAMWFCMLRASSTYPYLTFYLGTFDNIAASLGLSVAKNIDYPIAGFGAGLRMRITRSSSTSYGWSVGMGAGAQFTAMGSANQNPGFTPTHYGFGVSTFGGASEVIANFDYLRHL